MSKVENFRVTPSLPTLVKIAAALDMPMEKLFEGLDDKTEVSILRKGDFKQVERDAGESTIQYYDLAHKRPNRGMDPFELIIPSSQAEIQPNLTKVRNSSWSSKARLSLPSVMTPTK